MTNEQAIYLLKGMRGKAIQSESEALDMAIEALQRGLENVNADSCSEKPNNSDLISRQDAIDVAKQHWYKPDIAKELEKLPSAQPDLLEDGTLMITVPNGMLNDVKRVLVDEVGTKFCKVMYQDEPERKKGEWIHKPDIYLDEQTWECSECGEPWIFIEGTPSENNANFCPNCGSYNGGNDDGDE